MRLDGTLVADDELIFGMQQKILRCDMFDNGEAMEWRRNLLNIPVRACVFRVYLYCKGITTAAQ